MKPSFTNILVSTDFSEAGKSAFATAIKLCSYYDATLHILHVLEESYFIPIHKTVTDVPIPNEKNDHEARDKLYNLRESVMKEYQIPARIHMPKGFSVDEICRTAAEIPADLIIMGTHGSSGMRDFFIGTTAYNVIKNISRPVLTIPRNFEEKRFRKILFTVRPVKGIKEKYDLVEPFLKHPGVSIHIAILSLQNREAQFMQYEDELKEIITSLKNLGIAHTIERYACRNFALKVLELSDLLKVDLIAINATLHHKDKGVFLDPYTRQVINHAKSPVLNFRS